MEEDPRHRFFAWTEALRPGSHRFPATVLLSALAAGAALWLTPPLAFAFGSGWAPPLFAALFLFGLLSLFRKIIFKNLYPDPAGDVDAALVEYMMHQHPAHSREEEEATADLLENALHLKDVRAYNCMAPRPEIVHIDVKSPVESLKQLFTESKLSRILISDGDLDQVLGYVHVQQMFSRPTTIRQAMLPIDFVPETIAVSELLNKFIRNRCSIACVVDEYGSVAGLITLEDALEQLFGEIDDEHDQEEFIDSRISPQEYLFSGRLEIDYLNKKYPELELPQGDYATLSGYLVTVAQNIPAQGARLELDGKVFQLEMVGNRKIETVRVFLL
jgi:putative hemolysin